MRPVLAMATFVLLLALTPVVAQHGGGHVSAGGHGGFAGHAGFSGHSSSQAGGHSFGGTRSGPGFAPHSPARAFSHAPMSSTPLSTRNFNHARGPLHGSRRQGFGFRNNCYGYGCGWGYGYPYAYPYLGGGVDPYWWWDSGSSNGNDQEQQYSTGSSDEMNAQNYEAQPGDQDAYVRPSPAPRQEERAETSPATVLVFRDQHRQEVQNYAIVGQTLWSFAPQHTQKIPLSDLDLPATTKVNDERGVDFRVPVAGQGQ